MEANNVLSTEFNCTAFQEAQTDTNGDKCKEQKKMEEPIKILQEKKISALKFEVHKREFCINRFHEAKKFRITASKCQRVASKKESTSPVAALQEILHYKQPFQTDFNL